MHVITLTLPGTWDVFMLEQEDDGTEAFIDNDARQEFVLGVLCAALDQMGKGELASELVRLNLTPPYKQPM
jgi:hypothetical protein